MTQRSIKMPQRKVVVLAFTIDMTSSNALAGLCANQVSLNTDHGAGDVSIDLNEPLQDMVLSVTSATDGIFCTGAVTDADTIRIKAETDAGIATDALMHVVIYGSEVTDRL